MFHFNRLLKIFPAVLLALLFTQTVNSQALVKLRSALSNGGSSVIVTSGDHNYYLQQSIGQSSVIGLAQDNKYLLRQGFIQPLTGSIPCITLYSIPARVFPNPFSESFIISFDEEITDILHVTFYDLNGKIVFLKKYAAAREIILDVSYLEPSIYILKMNTITQCSYLKMIKL